MTAARPPSPPVPLRTRLLTSAEFATLPESGRRYELQGGNIVMSPSPVPEHQLVLFALAGQLGGQTPTGWPVVPGVDVDLELATPTRPGFVRVPDLVIATDEGLRRRRRDGGILRAEEIVLAVEVASPATVRVDRTIKRAECADAGIGHYWLLDLPVDTASRIALTACHLGGELGYVDEGPFTGEFRTDQPCALRIDLDTLLP